MDSLALTRRALATLTLALTSITSPTAAASPDFSQSVVSDQARFWWARAVADLNNADTFSVSLDGRTLFQVRDTTFPARGAIGLWTNADAVTWFDDLQIAVHP